ncbi:MAG TPA: serine--tRNA ligase, partial [Acidimicrobiales bacterium]|nr:serine--tRNA ligase [Acidimicrobiales bacterium]
MIDIRRVRTDLDGVTAALARKGVDPADVERLAQLDSRRRELAGRGDEIRARIKALSREVAAARRTGDDDKAAALAEESRGLGDEERAVDAEAGSVESAVVDLLLRTPNLPDERAPEGTSA